jgi:hypothetical protein
MSAPFCSIKELIWSRAERSCTRKLESIGAGDGDRTRDVQLGKLVVD